MYPSIVKTPELQTPCTPEETDALVIFKDELEPGVEDPRFKFIPSLDTTWKVGASEEGANPHFFVLERKNGLF